MWNEPKQDQLNRIPRLYQTEHIALTVFESTDTPVVVAVNTNNLQAVCSKLKSWLPKLRIVIAADNDIDNENAGRF